MSAVYTDQALVMVSSTPTSAISARVGTRLASSPPNGAAISPPIRIPTVWIVNAAQPSVTMNAADTVVVRKNSTVFTVPKLMHQTVLAPKASLGQIEQKSECPGVTPDVVCTDPLPPVTNAVGSMDFVDGGLSWVCTGTLIANRGATQQGYFLTANHCINNQSAASSLHVFWFYRSSACDSTTVNPGTVPSFSGADLRYNKTEFSGSLRTPVGTDTSLLDIVRMALSGIERYNQVTIGRVSDLAVIGYAADDVSCLIAALLDNATKYSPGAVTINVHLADAGDAK